MGPDDLEPGKRYQFHYTAARGSFQVVTARFLRMEVDRDAVWFWFRRDGDDCDVPYDYATLGGLMRIGPPRRER